MLNKGQNQRSIVIVLHIGRDKVDSYVRMIPPEVIGKLHKVKT